jgi:predicted component of type VI protein secretion system
MRGEDRTSGAFLSYVDIEARIGAKHPMRTMRRLRKAALADLNGAFSALYQAIGRRSIAPERLLRATLLQLLHTIRLERQLVERVEFDLLFRWFVGLSIDEKAFDASSPRTTTACSRRSLPGSEKGEKLAASGLKYNRFHTTALCSPSREVLLTDPIEPGNHQPGNHRHLPEDRRLNLPGTFQRDQRCDRQLLLPLHWPD